MNEAQKFIGVLVLILIVVSGIVASFRLAQSDTPPAVPEINPVQLVPNAQQGDGQLHIQYPLEYYIVEA